MAVHAPNTFEEIVIVMIIGEIKENVSISNKTHWLPKKHIKFGRKAHRASLKVSKVYMSNKLDEIS